MRDVDVPQLGVVAALNQRGPVNHVQFGLEAGTLELLGHDQRHVVVKVILAAGQDANGFTLVPSGHGHALGFFLVTLVVQRGAGG